MSSNNDRVSKKQSLGYVTAEEEDTVKKMIFDSLGFEPPIMTGWHLLIKLWVNDDELQEFEQEDGSKVKLYIPEEVRNGEKFQSVTGLVIAMGDECYTDKKKKWCRIGDFVGFPRHAGTQVYFEGVPCMVLDDDKMFCIVKDPRSLTRIPPTFKSRIKKPLGVHTANNDINSLDVRSEKSSPIIQLI